MGKENDVTDISVALLPRSSFSGPDYNTENQNQQLQNATHDLRTELDVLKDDNEALNRENKMIKEDLQVLKEENNRLKIDNEVLQDDVKELQDILDVSDAPLSSCQEHYDQGDRVDGVYTIQPLKN